jgi:hypothetical protein
VCKPTAAGQHVALKPQSLGATQLDCRLTLYSTTQSGLDLRDMSFPTRCSSSLAAVALGSSGENCMNTRRSDFNMAECTDATENDEMIP